MAKTANPDRVVKTGNMSITRDPGHKATPKNNRMKNAQLVYVHDPMCSWCWGFRPVLQQLLASLPANIKVIRMLGGLAADSDSPMPEEMQRSLQQTWRVIQGRIPGTAFNFDFWANCAPRRSTWPACRAVIAARRQGAKYDEEMTHAIQTAYYLNAKNPADDSTLIELAESIGLDRGAFADALNSTSTRQVLADEIDFGRTLGVQGFPSLVLIANNAARPITVDYTEAKSMLNALSGRLPDY